MPQPPFTPKTMAVSKAAALAGHLKFITHYLTYFPGLLPAPTLPMPEQQFYSRRSGGDLDEALLLKSLEPVLIKAEELMER